MRRPTRTRRLSIAAMVSMLAFVAVAMAEIRSFRVWDGWFIGNTQRIAISRGYFQYGHLWISSPELVPFQILHVSGHDVTSTAPHKTFLGVSYEHVVFWQGPPNYDLHLFSISVSFPLLLLLIIPTSWLIARPADAPAFAVVTDAKQSK